MKALHLLDASSFIYRSFFALPPLSTKKGFPTGAIYGFLRTLLSIIRSERPEYMAVVFDSPAPTRREKVFKDYKAGRPPMPDTLKVQIPVIKELLGLMGVPVIERPGYEADDLIAVLSKRFAEKGFRVKIYTPDKDMLQLVDDRITVVNPVSWETFTPERVRAKFGVPPDRIPDYLALVGDKVDNVQGVKGVGPKTAVKLIEKFGGVEGILRSWERFKRMYPEADREVLRTSYTLVKPITDLDLDLKEGDLKVSAPRMDDLRRKLTDLEMKSIVRDLEKTLRYGGQGALF
ncbi:MAG: 5'-3' exonuclease H3TH domain-containing protein [Aquificota bacterium]|nr:5'-3' exonuclease H3TH domain-containing protein [Aquificota bacterium]